MSLTFESRTQYALNIYKKRIGAKVHIFEFKKHENCTRLYCCVATVSAQPTKPVWKYCESLVVDVEGVNLFVIYQASTLTKVSRKMLFLYLYLFLCLSLFGKF